MTGTILVNFKLKMLISGKLLNAEKGYGIETYYGPQAQQKVQARMKDLNIPFILNQVWVEPEEMWLYENKPMTKDVLSLKGLLTPIPN